MYSAKGNSLHILLTVFSNKQFVQFIKNEYDVSFLRFKSVNIYCSLDNLHMKNYKQSSNLLKEPPMGIEKCSLLIEGGLLRQLSLEA